ncbi:MAG: hypothetical protein V4476_01380 [Pseudomonadota bacterium]
MNQTLWGKRGGALALQAVAMALLGMGGAHAVVLKPTVESVEVVATDAGLGNLSSVPNSWGGHQTRITRSSDGTVRILYLRDRADSYTEWRLMKRDPVSAVWSLERSGTSTDDVFLLRDPRDDRAYVVAFPDGTPSIYASPTFAPVKIPGAWQALPATARHYGGAGIGVADATLCVKASHEFPVLPITGTTNTEYACGQYSPTTKAWTWSELLTRNIGLRHGYDIIIPNPSKLAAGMYGYAQRDLYKDAAGIPALDPSAFPYVFNGVRRYKGNSRGTNVANTFSSGEVVPPLVKNSLVVSAPPQLRLLDAMIDSKGRKIITYYQDDPLQPTLRSRKIVVLDADAADTTLANINGGTTLPPYGGSRVVEDPKGRLWVLWTAAGSAGPNVRVFPLTETPKTATTPAQFALGAYTELGAAFMPYSIDGYPMVASTRGGNANSYYIDLLYDACHLTYQKGISFNTSLCYDRTKGEKQTVIYGRIRLPD